ncbi:hypothetical protein A5735_08785 [Mycolicibacter heraklionensis]|nr:hypothetical protein A5715_13075 [Mycolicibacter heraklionensis]OMC16253.1 hypothetical protein A5735_08785 [Mycolicibacter heraklionensis]
MRSLLSIVGIAAVIGCAAPAYADPDASDAAFLNSLKASGLAFSSSDQAIAAGRAICTMADSGETGLQVVKRLTDDNPGLTMDGAAQFAAAAASAYCPQHLHK